MDHDGGDPVRGVGSEHDARDGGGGEGRRTADAQGTLLAIHPYATTLAYCPVEEVDSWLLGVARAGFDDHEVLVLLDDDGHEAQRLQRPQQSSTDATPPPVDR